MNAVGGNILTDAFGIVAMVAMTPLITIQTLRTCQRAERKLWQNTTRTSLNKLKTLCFTLMNRKQVQYDN